MPWENVSFDIRTKTKSGKHGQHNIWTAAEWTVTWHMWGFQIKRKEKAPGGDSDPNERKMLKWKNHLL